MRCAALDGPLLAGDAAIAANGRCGRELGPARSRLTTAGYVADVEAIRRALRLPRPAVIGFSYGTLVARVYARAHPRVVRRMVLDGAFPVDDLFLRAIATSIPRVAADGCRSTGACDPATIGTTIATLAARLRTDPVALADGRDLDEALLATVLGPLLQTKDPQVLRAVVQAATGDTAALIALTEAATGAVPAGSTAFSAALGIAVQCNDYRYAYDLRASVPRRRAQLAAALGRLPADAFAPFSTAGWAGLGNDHPSTCLSWPRTTVPAALRLPRGDTTRVPALVMAGTDDLQTPIDGARQVAQALRTRVLVVPGAPHITTQASACALGAATTFLRSGRRPAGACPRLGR